MSRPGMSFGMVERRRMDRGPKRQARSRVVMRTPGSDPCMSASDMADASEPGSRGRAASRALRGRYLTVTAADAFAVDVPARATTFAT
jgi:hypothetical protein